MKLIVRGGGGLFYDRVGIESIVPAMEQGNPYSATINYAFPNAGTLQNLYPAAASTPIPGYQGRYFDAACATFGTCSYATGSLFPGQPGSSNLSTPMLINQIHTPLVRQYNLGIQYEFASGWVLDLGYAGSAGINLLDASQNLNTAKLIPAGGSIALNGSGGPVTVTTNTTGQRSGARAVRGLPSDRSGRDEIQWHLQFQQPANRCAASIRPWPNNGGSVHVGQGPHRLVQRHR